MRTLLSSALAVLLLAAGSASADPLIQTLPADGMWSSYHVTQKVEGVETNPTWIIRSVGGKMQDGKPCRWIELQGRDIDPATNQERNFVLYKLLVAEEEFGKGKDPLSKALNVWVKFGDGDPQEYPSIAAVDPFLSMIITGPTGATKKLDAKEPVDWQEGRLQCDVYTGTSTFEVGVIKAEATHRVLYHPDVPFGIAGAKQEFKVMIAGNEGGGSAEWSLTAHGKDAKSELPNIE